MRSLAACSLALAAATSGIFSFSAADHNGLGLDAFEMLIVKGGKFAVLDR